MVVVWIAVRVTVRANTIQNPNPNIIGVRDGGGGQGEQLPPPNSGRESTLFGQNKHLVVC